MPVTSNRQINYLSKDFDSIKTDLMDYVKRHFHQTGEILMTPLVAWHF